MEISGEVSGGKSSRGERPLLHGARELSLSRVTSSSSPRVTTSSSPRVTQEEGPNPRENIVSVLTFGIRKRDELLSLRQSMLASMNAYAVVLVLTAALTFQGFLQPPGGLLGTETNNQPAGTLQRPGKLMNSFITYIIISFVLAVAGLIVCMSCFAFVLRMPRKSFQHLGREGLHESFDFDENGETLRENLEKDITRLRRSLKWAEMQEVIVNILFLVSLCACLLAFRYAALIVTKGLPYYKALKLFDWLNTAVFIFAGIYTLAIVIVAFPFSIFLLHRVKLFIQNLRKRFKKPPVVSPSDKAHGLDRSLTNIKARAARS